LSKLRASRVNANAMNVGPRSSRPTRKAVLKQALKADMKILRNQNAASAKKNSQVYVKGLKQQAAAQKEATRMKTIAEEDKFYNMFSGLSLK
jgi:hypothetical protein